MLKEFCFPWIGRILAQSFGIGDSEYIDWVKASHDFFLLSFNVLLIVALNLLNSMQSSIRFDFLYLFKPLFFALTT